MAVAELFTKKKIADVKREDDVFDYEYMRRVERLGQKGATVDDLKQLLIDYEEFLPEGLQKFRHATEREFKLLIKQIRDFFSRRALGLEPPMEPTEFFMLLVPPLIVLPRQWAIHHTRLGRKMTWGEAFHDLVLTGAIEKVMRRQEQMYKHTIEVKEYHEQKGIKFRTEGDL